MICLALGAFRPWFNFFGVLCTPCTFCAHFAIIVTTGVFRFSDFGKLCAITTLPSLYTSSDIGAEPSSDWTYAKDGSMILTIWLLQLFTFCVCCGLSSYPLCRKSENNRVKDEAPVINAEMVRTSTVDANN